MQYNKKTNVVLGEKKQDREIIFKIVIAIAFIVLLFRIMYLQIYKGPEFSYLSERNQYKLIKIESPRGKIYDSKGRLVVTNGTGYRLIYLLDREENPEYIDEISKLTHKEKDYIEKRIKYGEIFPYTKENVILEDLDEENAYKIMEVINNYPYLEVQAYSKRRYLYDDVASHTIGYIKKITEKEYESLKNKGYTARDIVGKTGIEKYYDYILKGEPGYEYIEVNALNKIQRQIEEKKNPILGKDIYIGVDIELQKYMEEQFKADGRSGSFIALNPKNGEIKTIVSYPTYSLNLFSSQISSKEWNKISNDPRKILTNKSISGEYPPGSIFKAMSAIAFLNAGLNPKEKYMDYTGYYQIGKWKWRAWKPGGHGPTDLKKSLVESANPYYYRNADRFGSEIIINTAKDFGLNDKTGIDIPGERKGVIPDPEWKKKKIGTSWYKGDGILLSIGQGYTLVTPIQMAKVYSFIANKGWAYEPHVASKIVNPYDQTFKEVVTKKTEIKKYSSDIYNIINEALIATVQQDNGTTKILRNKHVKVAAKSGSAQNPHSKLTHAWVAGYFPADNPEIVFVCLLEGAGSGGAVAGEMTKKFLNKYLEIEHGIKPEIFGNNHEKNKNDSELSNESTTNKIEQSEVSEEENINTVYEEILSESIE